MSNKKGKKLERNNEEAIMKKNNEEANNIKILQPHCLIPIFLAQFKCSDCMKQDKSKKKQVFMN